MLKEDLKLIQIAEKDALDEASRAAEEARSILVKAREDGVLLIEEIKDKVKKEVSQTIQEAEVEGKKQADKILAEAEKHREQLKKEAVRLVDKAVNVVKEMVINVG